MKHTRLGLGVAAVGLGALVAACGTPPPAPTTTTTTTTEAPPAGPTVAPLMLTEPVGATGAVVQVVGTDVIDGTYLSTATTSRLLDPDDLEDRALLLEAVRQVDPASGRWVRATDSESPLEVCEELSEDPVCEPIPGTEGYTRPTFSPDGTKLSAVGYDFGLDETTVIVLEAATLEPIVSDTSATIVTNPFGAAWRPDSSALAYVEDNSVVTLQAEPGATPEVVEAPDDTDVTASRQPGFVAGWSSQDRILSIWTLADLTAWPPAGTLFVHSVAPDGSDPRDLGPADPLGVGTVAPDGSLVWPERREVTDGTSTAIGSAPVAFADAAVPSKQPLSTPWSGIGPQGFRASETWVYGFVNLP